MKGVFALLPLALQSAWALPGYVNEEKRGLLGNLLGDVDGLLGSIAASVDPDNKRPEPGTCSKIPNQLTAVDLAQH